MVSASTWQTLGLGVAAAFTGAGALAVFAPAYEGNLLFNLGSAALAQNPDKFANAAESREDKAVSVLLPLLGARNWALAASMFVLHRQGNWSALGTVILSGSAFVGILDGIEVFRRRGPVLAGIAGATASLWALVGYALVEGWNN
ncbi:hypothetical protein Q8F55_006039 [Vanrija albida]|uniref:Uncharacterized protein n=1 Tax=Vanrija albida TaxID=181172 RepID=A0ABR3Q3I1_9TREE